MKRNLNTKKDKIDIIIKEKNDEVLILECKSIKEKGYNKYSSISRQMNSYKTLAEKNGITVKKMFVVAPSFSDDFVNECGLDYELNLSLITADTLYEIFQVCDESEGKPIPTSLLMRDVLIDKQRVLKALQRK